MSTNINSKKTWHPSRHETQEKVKRFRAASEAGRILSREERMRVLLQEDEENIEYLDCSMHSGWFS